MGCESTDVYHTAWWTYCLQKSYAYVPTVCVNSSPLILTGLSDGVREIYKTEGLKGLYRGTSLALFGVSNGAIQFMCYEELKRWGFERKRRQFAQAGREWTSNDDKLVSTRIHSHIIILLIFRDLV